MKAIFVLAAAALIGTGAYVGYHMAARPGDGSSPYSFPQAVVAEKRSPGQRYNAKVLYDESTKNYFFAIEGADGTRLILAKALVPNAGYHAPLVSLAWESAEKVSVIVDHDFGDGKLRFDFDVRSLAFTQAGTDPAPGRGAAARRPVAPR